jgi:non-specific serine/threonine protein kinase/serine/threonine-protein kinase
VDYWDEVESIFHEAVGLDPGRRSSFLDSRCSGRPDLAEEVKSLLDAHDRADRFIDLKAFTQSDWPDVRTDTFGLGVGDRVGRFRLLEEIGAGGMATVFRAERSDGDFDHQIAVKLMAGPMADPGVARRFHLERQILASLHHPNIVTLIDGGVASDGRGYLAMEFVEGVAITTYCREQQLSLAERLQLFRAICSGVHYAHRHGVVHRDLKPSNILVTAEGVPKVLDFGVAKLSSDVGSGASTHTTGFGIGPLTPAYASPEQLQGLAVTTSSDIYSLGVLLYELVVALRPYDVEEKNLEEILHVVAKADTPRPSSRLRNDSSSSYIPYDPKRALRGDVDAIVLKAMAKNPEERYASVDELSVDVLRYLEGQPVEARPPSLGYVVRKLAARHRVAFASTCVSLAFVLLALSLAVWQARVATLEQQRAERRFSEVRQLANTLIFDIHDAVSPLGGSTPVRETIVSEGLDYLQSLARDAEDDPELQEELGRAYARIGRIQGLPGVSNLGDREAAVSSFREGASFLRPLARRDDAPVETVSAFVDVLGDLSVVLASFDEKEDAEAAAREAVGISGKLYRRLPADDAARNLWARANFMAAIAVGWPDSLPNWEAARVVYEELLAERPDDPVRQRNVALVHKYLGSYFNSSRDHARAARHNERALSLDEARLAADPDNRQALFDVAIAMGNVAYDHAQLGDVRGAVELYERSLVHRRTLMESDPDDALARNRVAFAHLRLGEFYFELGDLSRALENARRSASLFDAASSAVDDRMRQGQVHWLLSQLAERRTQRVESCREARTAFALLSELSEETRLRYLAGLDDLLPAVAAHAAGCSAPTAQEWLEKNTSSSAQSLR